MRNNADITKARFAYRCRCGGLLCLVFSLTASLLASAAETPGTNASPRFPSLGEVVAKWKDKPVTAIEQAAEQGDLTAAHYLGYGYSSGQGLPRDAVKAVAWYTRAGNGRYLPSLYNLGLLYHRGEIVPRDLTNALHYYKLAAEAGMPGAQLVVGKLYREGMGVGRDPVEALEWFKRSANLGCADAMYELFSCYRLGVGVGRDDTIARNYLKEAAERGSATAQCEFGHYCEFPFDWDRYATSYPKSNNVAEAVHWYRLSVEQGHAGGEFHLALCYLRGKGVDTDEERGLELMRRSADQKHPYAQVKLAELYGRGIGEPRGEKDRPAALLRLAVERIDKDEQGAPIAPALSFRYQVGLGVDRDLVEASAWYCRAAAVDKNRYPLKDGLRANTQSASTQPFRDTLALYLKAVVENDAGACVSIGDMYLEGRDAPRAPLRAWVWFTLGLEKGAANARAKISEAEGRMAGDELKQRNALLAEAREQLDRVTSATKGGAAGHRSDEQ